MWNIIVWIVLGGFAGWLASLVTGRNRRQGCLMDIIVGVIGAFIGGLIYNLIWGSGFTLTPAAVDIGSIGGFVLAVMGAVVLLILVNLLTGRR